MKKLVFLSLLLFAILQSGCEKDATVEVPKTEPMPVLFSFLSPESSDIRVTLTMSKPVIGSGIEDDFPPIDTATVIIKDQTGKSQTLSYDANRNFYVVDQAVFPIFPGNTYTVSAVWDKYQVSGVTTIPEDAPDFDSIRTDNAGKTEWDDIQYKVSFKWNDIPAKSNYYRVVLEDVFYATFGDTTASSFGDKVFSDKNKEGLTISDKMDFYIQDGVFPTKNVFIYLLNTDIHYYEFHRRRINYYGDDPFSEPSPQYSNVSNGLGVVSSYRKSTRKIDF